MTNPDSQTKIFIFLERLWLIACGIGVIMMVYSLIKKDNDTALYFFGFFILSALLYLMRKRQRVRHETRWNAHKQEQQSTKNNK